MLSTSNLIYGQTIINLGDLLLKQIANENALPVEDTPAIVAHFLDNFEKSFTFGEDDKAIEKFYSVLLKYAKENATTQGIKDIKNSEINIAEFGKRLMRDLNDDNLPNAINVKRTLNDFLSGDVCDNVLTQFLQKYLNENAPETALQNAWYSLSGIGRSPQQRANKIINLKTLLDSEKIYEGASFSATTLTETILGLAEHDVSPVVRQAAWKAIPSLLKYTYVQANSENTIFFEASPANFTLFIDRALELAERQFTNARNGIHHSNNYEFVPAVRAAVIDSMSYFAIGLENPDENFKNTADKFSREGYNIWRANQLRRLEVITERAQEDYAAYPNSAPAQNAATCHKHLQVA